MGYKLKLKIDNNEIFDLNNKNNLKVWIIWKHIKQHKILKRLKDKSIKDEMIVIATDSYNNVNIRGQPIELDTCIDKFCEKETLSENDA